MKKLLLLVAVAACGKSSASKAKVTYEDWDSYDDARVFVKGVKYISVDKGLMPVQVSMDAVGMGVIYNVWCDLKLAFYNLVGA